MSDWIELGHTLEELDSLAAATSPWLPALAQQPEAGSANNEDSVEHRTDLGNSARLIRYFGADLAYTKQ